MIRTEPYGNGYGGSHAAAPSESLENDQQWPKLDPKALYGIAGDIIAAATANSEADPVAILATLLTHAGVVAGRGPRFCVSDDWHHARLFSAIVGRSARARKGTSEAPIRLIWEEAVRNGCPPLNWKPGPMSSGEGLIWAIRDEHDNDHGIPDKRLLIVEGELAAPLRAMRRQGNTLSTILRSAWDGRTLEPLTKAEPIKASDPHIGIVAHITMTELQAELSQVDLFNGFANRFLWFVARRSKLLPLATGMVHAEAERLGREYGARLTEARGHGEIEFSDEARALYAHHYPELTVDPPGLYGVVTARAEAQVIRLALTYAVLDGSPTITTMHLKAALAVWAYCNQSAHYLFGEAATDPVENRILSALASGPKTMTQIHEALGRHTEKARMDPALERMRSAGRIERIDQPTSGRPRTVWSLTPRTEHAKQANDAKEAPTTGTGTGPYFS